MQTDDRDFGLDAIEDLRTRTEYEAWLLEAAYELSDKALAGQRLDLLIYPPGGGPPTVTAFASTNVRLGDWREGFLKAGAPLVFVTTFKLLDMFFEWILAQNGKTQTFRFNQKIAALDDNLRFPHLVASRPWLKERLINLYRNLEPFRGTIVHERHFTSSDGGLEVSRSKAGVVGQAIRLSSDDLRALTIVVVSVLRYLEGTWILDSFCEKRLRWFLDKLTQLHMLPSLGQAQPRFITVRKYMPAGSAVQFDLQVIAKDALARNPKCDVVFDLSIIRLDAEQNRSAAYLIPSQLIHRAGTTLAISERDLEQYSVALPADFDWATVANDLGLIQ
jgi:hypothetical protein